MSQKPHTAIAVVGIDIGKNSFHVVGLDQRGAVCCVRSGRVVRWMHDLPICRRAVGMEACVGAHHLRCQAQGAWSRRPADAGEVRVRPYSKGQKNDFRDAEAIAEAVQRPTMKFVATKTADRLDLQALQGAGTTGQLAPGIINADLRSPVGARRSGAAGVAVFTGRATAPSLLHPPPDVLSTTHGADYRGLGWRLAPARRAGRRVYRSPRLKLLRARIPVVSG